MKKVIGPEETREIPVQKTSPQREPEKKTPKKKVERTKDWSYYAIIASLILILIPSIFLGVTIWKASKGTGEPVFGSRFKNDLAPAIEKENISNLETELLTIDGVESVDVVLKTATLRIHIPVSAETDKEKYETIAKRVEDKLYEVLPKEQYFQMIDTQMQYDYEVYVYHLGETPTIYTRYKSSRSTEPQTQFLSDAASPEMAEALLKRQEEKDNPQEDNTDVNESGEVDTEEEANE